MPSRIPKLFRPPLSDALKERFKNTYYPNSLTDKSFQPYVIAIGQTSLAWNALQEALCELFSRVAKKEVERDFGIFLAIWHSLDSDRAQRKMFSTIARRIWEIGGIDDAMHKDIRWLLAEADKLSDARNDVIHSPLVSRSNVVDPSNIKIQVASRMHPRAKKLGMKDILPEMRRCRDTAIILRDYCLKMDGSLNFGAQEWPWPEKPRLLSRVGKSPQVSRHRKTPPK